MPWKAGPQYGGVTLKDLIGSGGNFALAAGRAMYDFEEDAEVIARRSLEIAAEICVYTNGKMTVEIING